MSQLNKTGNWIYLITSFALEFPLDRLAIFYAKPSGQYLQGARNAGYDKYRERAFKMNISVDDYNDLIYRYFDEGPESISPKSVREDIEFEISQMGYTEDSFVSVAEIVTPFGTAKIYPEEYNVVTLDWALQLVKEGSHMIRYLNNDGSVRDKMKNTSISDKVFYLRSRGVKFTEAMKKISGDIKTQHLLYFDPLPQYINCYERNFYSLAERKIKYCHENDQEQLLLYQMEEDGKKIDFTLEEYLEHLDKEYAKHE